MSSIPWAQCSRISSQRERKNLMIMKLAPNVRPVVAIHTLLSTFLNYHHPVANLHDPQSWPQSIVLKSLRNWQYLVNFELTSQHTSTGAAVRYHYLQCTDEPSERDLFAKGWEKPTHKTWWWHLRSVCTCFNETLLVWDRTCIHPEGRVFQAGTWSKKDSLWEGKPELSLRNWL